MANNWPNHWLHNSSSTESFIDLNSIITTQAGSSFSYEKKNGISPKLYFKWVKKHFGLLGGHRLENRLKKLWKLVEEAEAGGQVALSERWFNVITREMRESEMYAAGFKIFIEKEHLERFKTKVRGREISIDPLKNFTRPVPKDVLKRKTEAERLKLFDGFVVVHYDPDKKARAMTEEEERKDPILFGIIKESNRYYFIGDWEDEFCDLTLEDIVDKLNLDDEDMKLTKTPTLERTE